MSSFNVQNAKSLEITEGEVKIIQDSDDKQLWGKLNYTTKYEGDTTQATLTGKNKLGYTYASIKAANSGSDRVWDDTTKTMSYHGVDYKINDDGSILVNGTASSVSFLNLINPLSGLVSSTEYILNGCPAGGSASTYSLRLYTGGSYVWDGGSGLNFTYDSQDIVRVNISGGTTLPTGGLLFKPMIRLATETNPDYEIFCGGIPSPNPDYPQTVSVVTGTQTITLTDAGGNTEDFTVSLGSTELCKISTYKDYIYKDGTDWKTHKENGKIVYDGSEPWQKVNLAFQTTAISEKGPYISSGFSNYFTFYPTQTGITSAIPDGQYGFNTSKVPTFRNDDCADAPAFKTWLSNHNTSIYYNLATATDTTITDTDLIAQLDAIETWLTRCGYTATVSGNLPIVINQTEIV